MSSTAQPVTRGHILHAAVGYDVLVWLLLFGRERAFRERLVTLARIAPGESVLDVGCGTGSLAIAAQRRVASAGRVDGVDASAEMIARARKTAAKAGVPVTFTHGIVEALPFPAGQFDVVLNTLMLHHLPRDVRPACAREMRRVLKPGGRVLAVDFGPTPGQGKGLIAHLHRHGGLGPDEIGALLTESGFETTDTGPAGVRGLNFVRARAT